MKYIEHFPYSSNTINCTISVYIFYDEFFSFIVKFMVDDKSLIPAVTLYKL